MNKRMLPAATLVVAVALAFVGCQQQPAPAAKKVAKVVQPKLLDTQLDKALANQTSLVDRADKLKPDSRLPAAAAHSAGGQVEAQLAQHEAAPAKPTSADDKRSLAVWFSGNENDKRSLAVWFSGNEIGETDPCG